MISILIENIKPPKNTSPPLEKNSITPPDKIFSPPPPNEIVISLEKTLTSFRKKYSTPPDIITPSLKKIVNFTEKIFSPMTKSQFSPS